MSNYGPKLRKRKDGSQRGLGQVAEGQPGPEEGEENQVYGQRLAEMAKKHSSEAFYAFDDPLEAALFSVLIELMKELEKGDGDL